MSITIKIILTFLLLSLIYLSGVRLVSQLVIPTDYSSLWETRPAGSHRGADEFYRASGRLSALDPLSFGYESLLAQAAIAKESPMSYRHVGRAINTSVLDPEGWVLSGLLEAKKGRTDESIASFEKAVSLNPSRAATYLDEGLCLAGALASLPANRQPFYRNLVEMNLNLCLGLDPDSSADPRLCLAMASIAADKGNAAGAVSWLKRTVLRPPIDWPFALRKLALCFSLGQRVEALSSWDSIFSQHEFSRFSLERMERELKVYGIPDFAFFLAQIHLRLGKTESAEKDLLSLVNARPNVAEYRIALGNALGRLNHPREAGLCYEKALELSPANQEAIRKVTAYYGGK